MISIKRYLKDLLYLFYPANCAVCSKALYDNEKHLCSPCQLKLPYTKSYQRSPSPYNKLFWGKIPVVEVWPLLSYQKKSGVQQILHQIKYKNYPLLGSYLAEILAIEVNKNYGTPRVNAIIPVPMHPKKEYERGYNQAHYIAQGLSEVWKIRVLDDLVSKVTYTKTQTKKDRYGRFKNIEEVYRLNDIEQAKSLKGVVLADDVITTGATVEQLAKVLLKVNPDLLIYVATLAAA